MTRVEHSFRISAAGGQLVITGPMRQRVTVGATAFFRALPRLPTPRTIDLLMIAVGAYAVDRMVVRHRCGDASAIRDFKLRIEVQDPAFWSQPEVSERLVDILSFLTDDNWSVAFEPSPENWYQVVLPVKWFSPTRIALFSEGLDSAAGLADAAVKGNDRILLVTVGHYAALRRRTERQVSNLAELVPGLSVRNVSLLVSLRGGVARRLRLQETTQRSRAFLFCATAIAAAAAYDVPDIDVYENGVGAINLPPMTGMLLGGRATRSAHPSLLRKVAALGALIADQPITFSLPYHDLTKGELVAKASSRGLESWLQQSRSCVHTSPRMVGAPHCGICPACIERRVAFGVAQIEEDPKRYDVNLFRDPIRTDRQDYLDVFIEESGALLSGEASALRRLRAHLRSTEVDPAEDDKIFKLLCRNADQVKRVLSGARIRPLEAFTGVAL